ncbi:DNA repair helicase XPB [Ferviditalea candida]|uniref:DNA 3'-5' helicase n=1 Tax=Ferviditalea candida TaxID=3108399 RepID=A0ABU5ZFI5_9BACL|nr:DNA repair helicase XPB [Paenibacillaceae bacterium T2]
MFDDSRPLIVQRDCTVLLEVRNNQFAEARNLLSGIAYLVKSPLQLYTYRITPLSLWNAAAAGMKEHEIIEKLRSYSKLPLPGSVEAEIRKHMGRYGCIRLEPDGGRLRLACGNEDVMNQLLAFSSLSSYMSRVDGSSLSLSVEPQFRGIVKRELTRLGFPVIDLAGYHDGESLPIRLRKFTSGGKPFQLRDYQLEAVEAFYRKDSVYEGSGVLVLPCGAGKTVVGIAAMARLNTATLILTSSVTSVRQWKKELLDKTDLNEQTIGEYCGPSKTVRPVTIATYQILTHRKSSDDEFVHMKLFNERDWGLIIYDEVHLLPAPVFRVTAGIQATRRLGLTATLVREDGCEEDVFSLIGPKCYDVPWRQMEERQWISEAVCREIRVPFSGQSLEEYRRAGAREKHRIAGENPAKILAVQDLLRKHAGDRILIIGQYISQLEQLASELNAPLICGKVRHEQREAIYDRFNQGEIPVLVVSRVANFAVDLPDANVAIQVSGSFGSRQEEAQRLGRILRPKQGGNQSFFYSLVTLDSSEQEFSLKRQLFLVEQGYRYETKTVNEAAQVGMVSL